jgi:hypothetical protein
MRVVLELFSAMVVMGIGVIECGIFLQMELAF